MPVEVIGIDHVYLSVSDMNASEWFYDTVMLQVLGYHKGESVIAGDAHVHYYNRQFGFSLRPARSGVTHDPYAPGLHHFCFRVEDNAAVDQVAGRIPVLAGAAEANARETLAACETYAKFGASAVAIVSPFYYPLSAESVYAYFSEIGRNTPIDAPWRKTA